MSLKSARTTTALVASLSMILPQGIWIAPAQAQTNTVLLCLDLAEPPCPEGEPAEGTEMDAEAAAAAAKAKAGA